VSDLPPVRCEDPSTWRHKGEKIDLPRLLELIEENGGPEGLDLHGCDMRGIDATPDALKPHAEHYKRQYSPCEPPWLAISKGISLCEAHLERARLDRAKLGQGDLRGANLKGAWLTWAGLESADLYDAHLQDANLSQAQLQSAELIWTDLRGALISGNLRGAYLYMADLTDAVFLGGARGAALWYRARLEGTRLRRDQLGPAIGDELWAKGRGGWRSRFYEAKEAYMALKINFESIGRYDDAAWAYVKERQMEKALHFPTTAGLRWIREELRRGARRWRRKNPGRVRRFLRSSLLGRARWVWMHLRVFLGVCRADVKSPTGEEHIDRPRWLRNWLYELTTGYGERPQMPLVWAIAVIAAFTAVYAVAGNVASGGGGATHDLVTALTHSIAAFATVGFNTLEPVGWGARLLTAIEAMFGIGLFALFVFTLGNRMRRS